MINILHILHDEKFLDGAIDTFNATSSRNTYVSIDDDGPLRQIKVHGSEVLLIKKEDILSFMIDGNYQMVAFHTLTRDKYELVLQIPKSIKVLWLSWGYDIYEPWLDSPAVLPIELYKPLTKELLSSKTLLISRIFRKLKKIAHYKKYRDIQRERQYKLTNELDLQKRLLSRIDYLSTVLPSEYDILSKYEYIKAIYFPFQYVSNHKLNTDDIEENASIILVGNSATATNNHFDVFNVLKNRAILNKCIVPCSYGNDTYLSKLKDVLKNMQNVQVLDTFVPYEEYSKMLKACRVGVFGHLRQQAMGNIVTCMLHGSKVFLWRDSVAYQYFKSEGYIIYTIDDDLTNENIQSLMTQEERELNKKKLFEQFSYDCVVARLNSSLQTIQ